MKRLSVINAVPVFEEVQQELIRLLKELSKDEWNRSTDSSDWTVKDIAAHLLDGDIRRLSLHRDKLPPPEPEVPVTDYTSLVRFLDQLNSTWIRASERMSPRLLTELTEFLAPRVVSHLKSLDPDGTALFSVAWAGEDESPNWFDIAREYTEKWHHQQQVREATGRPLLVERKWLYPLIDTLIRGVPAVYRKYCGELNPRSLAITITGEIDDTWILSNQTGTWRLFKSEGERADVTVTLDDETAWKLFTKTISENEALNRMKLDGNRELGQYVAKTTSFMK